MNNERISDQEDLGGVWISRNKATNQRSAAGALAGLDPLGNPLAMPEAPKEAAQTGFPAVIEN